MFFLHNLFLGACLLSTFCLCWHRPVSHYRTWAPQARDNKCRRWSKWMWNGWNSSRTSLTRQLWEFRSRCMMLIECRYAWKNKTTTKTIREERKRGCLSRMRKDRSALDICHLIITTTTRTKTKPEVVHHSSARQQDTTKPPTRQEVASLSPNYSDKSDLRCTCSWRWR